MHEEETANAPIEKHVQDLDLDGALDFITLATTSTASVIWWRCVGVAFSLHIKQANGGARLELKRILVGLLLAHLVPCHDLWQTYLGRIVLVHEKITLSVSTIVWVSVEMTDQGLGLIASVRRWINLPLREYSLFKGGVSELLGFLWNAFLRFLDFNLLRRFFDEASTKKLSHLFVIVHGSRLKLVLALKRADEHFVRHWVKHVKQLLLLKFDHLLCQEKL